MKAMRFPRSFLLQRGRYALLALVAAVALSASAGSALAKSTHVTASRCAKKAHPHKHCSKVGRGHTTSQIQSHNDPAGGPPPTATAIGLLAPPSSGVTPSFTAGPAPLAGVPVLFDALGSTDSTGQILAYAWSFGDGTTAAGPLVTHAFAQNGIYTVDVAVLSSGGRINEEEQQVKVGP